MYNVHNIFQWAEGVFVFQEVLCKFWFIIPIFIIREVFLLFCYFIFVNYEDIINVTELYHYTEFQQNVKYLCILKAF